MPQEWRMRYQSPKLRSWLHGATCCALARRHDPAFTSNMDWSCPFLQLVIQHRTMVIQSEPKGHRIGNVKWTKLRRASHWIVQRLNGSFHLSLLPLKDTAEHRVTSRDVAARSQNGPKMIPKWSQNCPKMIPKWSQNGPNMIPKWSQNGPKMIPKWSQNDPKIIPKWFQNDPKMI